ncbi:MAG: hypothetical protein ACK56F_07475, partial [bacterium]
MKDDSLRNLGSSLSSPEGGGKKCSTGACAIGREIKWLWYRLLISGQSSILKSRICCPILYSVGDDVLPCARPHFNSKSAEYV